MLVVVVVGVVVAVCEVALLMQVVATVGNKVGVVVDQCDKC